MLSALMYGVLVRSGDRDMQLYTTSIHPAACLPHPSPHYGVAQAERGRGARGRAGYPAAPSVRPALPKWNNSAVQCRGWVGGGMDHGWVAGK